MLKECSHCKKKINFVEFYKITMKNNYKYTCPNCGAEYCVTNKSKFIFMVIFALPFIYSLWKCQVWVSVVWVALSFLIIEPLVFQYTPIIKNKK